MWNVTEFAQFWMNKSKVGQYTLIKTRYGLVSVNIKPQKTAKICILHVLHVCVWMNSVSFTTHIYFYSATPIYEYMKTWT